MKAALGAALAFLVAACAVLALILFDTKRTAETLEADRLALAREGLVQYARDNGWAKTKEMLHQQAAWSGAARPHAWLLNKADDHVVDAEAGYPAEVALRALSRPTKSIAVEATGDSRRLRVAEAALPGNRLLVGIAEPPASQQAANVIYAVMLSGVAGMFGAFTAVFLASRRSNRRIDRIKAALSAFLAGDMTRRVVFPGPVDSLYEIAHGLNRVLDQSETLAQNLNNLSSDIAHNLKKPLTRLRSRLEAARNDADMAARYRAGADDAVRNLDGIITIFEALLNISQFQAGSGRSRFQDVDLRELTNHIIETYQSIIEESGKRLQTSLPDKDIPYVRGDPGLIMELLVNIIENAIQHCPQGTTISVSVVPSIDEISVIVADDGQGIPAQAVEDVLRRFQRLDVTRPGHGIGMPFAVAVAKLHDATLELADNHPGLKVTVSFPIDFTALTPQLGLRMRSGLQIKLHSKPEYRLNS